MENEEKGKFDLYGYSLFVIVIIGIVLALEWINWNSLFALAISFCRIWIYNLRTSASTTIYFYTIY